MRVFVVGNICTSTTLGDTHDYIVVFVELYTLFKFFLLIYGK